MHITFKPFTADDVPTYFTWCDRPHVKDKWFRPGYEPKEAIGKKIGGTGDVVPFVILLDRLPIGYIQYYHLTPACWHALQDQPKGTVGFDIFIGEEDYIGKGIGTDVVKAFVQQLSALPDVTKIIVDPFMDDKRAIRCYEKAGFVQVREAVDDKGSAIVVMERLTKPRKFTAPWRGKA